MPFKSYAEAGWMKHNKPALYREWVSKYGLPKDVPLRVGGGKKHPDAKARLKAAKRM